MLTDQKIIISVVIPTINEEKYLTNTLKSLVNQTVKNVEIIVSDGGSTDNTVNIAKKFSAKVVIIKNSSVTLARQKGVEIAKGSIIVGADADTIYPPTHLEQIISDFDKDSSVIAVGGGGIFSQKPWWVYWFWKITYFKLGKIFQYFHKVVYVPAFNLSFKKTAFDQIGNYNTFLDFGGDELDILSRLKKVGKVYFDEKLICWPSSRRANVGFFSMLVKHTLIDYYLGYLLAKIFHKPIIRGKPIR